MSGKVITTIIISVLCLIFMVSPIDLSPGMFGIDDIGALIAMIASIVGTVKSFKSDHIDKKGNKENNDFNDVPNN